ncbi:MAG: DinB family protein [Trueperaceae bacterium]
MTAPTDASAAAAEPLFVIGPREGFTANVGTIVAQLQVARHYLMRATRELGPEDLDAKPGTAPNTIGAILRHLNAAERMFQVMTFEDRAFDEAERARWWPDFTFERPDEPRGLAIDAYHEALAATRAKTLAAMRERDDGWLDEPKTFFGRPANVHYYWTHFLMDEARHTGQVILARKHLIAGADPEFEPYRI